MTFKKAIFILSLLFIFACNSDDNVTPQPKLKKRMFEDSLMKANEFLLQRDSELIQSYVNRHQLDMTFSDGGIWYEIYRKTNGKKIKNGDIIRYKYRIELLDGTLCYDWKNDGIRQIKIGSTGKESGLEKGFLMMKEGEKARFIIPPHLAYGLIGDMKKIPARSVLVYNIEIIEVVDF